jgi:hypothetical protein
LDLGQANDPTALAVIEKVGKEYQCSHLKRFKLGTTYTSIVEQVGTLMDTPPLRGNAILIVDYTGVGRPVVDLLRHIPGRDFNVKACTITSGGEEGHDISQQNWTVPKRDLVNGIQILLGNGTLKFAKSLKDVQALLNELMAFRVKITEAGNDTYNAREGAHDDLLLALALAVWWSTRHSSTVHCYIIGDDHDYNLENPANPLR